MKAFAFFSTLVILFAACSKKDSTTSQDVKFPEIINGSVGNLLVKYIDLSSTVVSGSFDINTPDGNHYYCEFGQISSGDPNASNINSTIKIDTTNVLSSASVIANDTAGNAIPVFKNVVLPNTINIVFKSGADAYYTKGVKEIHVSLISNTGITYSFFDDNYTNRKKYASDKNLCISKINQIVSLIKGASPVACQMSN